MKKLLVLMLCALTVMMLVSCNPPAEKPDDSAPSSEDVKDDVKENTDNTEKDTPSAEEFSFTLEGVKLKPGQSFDHTALPEASSVYEVPSCALEGSDLVYNYTTVEVTAYNDGSGPVIYCIYIADANTPTDEGLYLGDGLEQVKSLYGEDYREEAGQIIYTRGKSELILLMQDGSVISIEYRMVT